MKKFLIGFLAASALFLLTGATLVMSGTVEFSTVNVEVNGQRVGNVGETYTLGNGEQAPYSISYKDAKGGATTYLPVRKISELLGVDIQWDGANNAVQVVEEGEQNAASDTNTGEELDALYEQFVSFWDVIDSEMDVGFRSVDDYGLLDFLNGLDDNTIWNLMERIANENRLRRGKRATTIVGFGAEDGSELQMCIFAGPIDSIKLSPGVEYIKQNLSEHLAEMQS